MCGPSNSQEQLAASGASFASLLGADYNERFAQQSGILQNLNATLTPIVEAGPDQQGFGASELAALNTAAIEGVGQNYAKASQALNNQLAVRGGGTGDVSTAGDAALKEQLVSNAAAKSSDLQNQITRANYEQGRRNWSEATAGLRALAGEYDPTAFSGQSLNANQNAFGEATKVQDEKNQEEASIAGGITSLVGGIPSFASGISALTSAISPNADTSVLDAIGSL